MHLLYRLLILLTKVIETENEKKSFVEQMFNNKLFKNLHIHLTFLLNDITFPAKICGIKNMSSGLSIFIKLN